MNSLPLIHHHLFVAAIGSEDRPRPKPCDRQQRSVEKAEPARAFAWEVLNSSEPMPAAAARLLHTSANTAGA